MYLAEETGSPKRCNCFLDIVKGVCMSAIEGSSSPQWPDKYQGFIYVCVSPQAMHDIQDPNIEFLIDKQG